MKSKKEDFYKVWKDSSKDSILNQFWYEHRLLNEQYEIINKAIDKLYLYGEILDGNFQKEMLDILGDKENE